MRESGKPWAWRMRIAFELEKMPPPVPVPGARIRSIQQSRTAVIMKCSRRKLARRLAVRRFQCSITAPSVDRFGQLLNCPAIHIDSIYV